MLVKTKYKADPQTGAGKILSKVFDGKTWGQWQAYGYRHDLGGYLAHEVVALAEIKKSGTPLRCWVGGCDEDGYIFVPVFSQVTPVSGRRFAGDVFDATEDIAERTPTAPTPGPVRYITFWGYEFYPAGGANDSCSVHRTLEDAIAAMNKAVERSPGDTWAHVYDQEEQKIVAERD